MPRTAKENTRLAIIILSIVIIILIFLNVYTIKTMNEAYFNLSLDYIHLNEEYESLKQQHLGLKESISDMESFENKIASAMDWFKDNSNLKTVPDKMLNLKNLLESTCFSKVGERCEIDIGCIGVVNAEYGLLMGNEGYISETGDKLQTIKDTLSHRGGDCEDLALLVKAEYNYLLGKCLGKGGAFNQNHLKDSSRDLVFLERTYNSRDTCYYESDKMADIIYYSFCERQKIADPYFYVICGTTTDSGHCLLGASQNKIITSKDINSSFLNSLIFIEVNGFYQEYPLMSIEKVITDSDIYSGDYRYDSDKTTWKGYGDFLKHVQELKSQLIEIKYLFS